jgi:hypothetical protein
MSCVPLYSILANRTGMTFPNCSTELPLKLMREEEIPAITGLPDQPERYFQLSNVPMSVKASLLAIHFLPDTGPQVKSVPY